MRVFLKSEEIMKSRCETYVLQRLLDLLRSEKGDTKIAFEIDLRNMPKRRRKSVERVDGIRIVHDIPAHGETFFCKGYQVEHASLAREKISHNRSKLEIRVSIRF